MRCSSMDRERYQPQTIEDTWQAVFAVLAEKLPDAMKGAFNRYLFEGLVKSFPQTGPCPWHKYYFRQDGPLSILVRKLSRLPVPPDTDPNTWGPAVFLDMLMAIESRHSDRLSDLRRILPAAWSWRELGYQLYAKVIDAVCLLAYRTSVEYLLTRVSSRGHRSSLYRLVTLDKTFLGTRAVQRVIAQCQLRSNRRFFRALSRAVNTDLIAERGPRAIEWQAVELLRLLSFRQLTYRQLYNLLREKGSVRLPSFKTFQQRLLRAGLSTSHLKSTLGTTSV